MSGCFDKSIFIRLLKWRYFAKWLFTKVSNICSVADSKNADTGKKDNKKYGNVTEHYIDLTAKVRKQKRLREV
jgi:hypothetical protein